jgi:hypothetical protein
MNPSSTEYRLPRCLLELGIVCAVLFGLMGIVSTAAALFNFDGSFPHPVAAAVVCGVFWSTMTLLSGYLILAYYRCRLTISSEAVRITGCFRTHEIKVASVTRALWQSLFQGGSLVLFEGDRRVTIHFGSYTHQDRAELIQYFRTALAGCAQEGWEQFEATCLPAPVDYTKVRATMQRTWRFTLIAWGLAIPLMYAILIWTKLNDALPNGNWLVVALFPPVSAGLFIGLVWLAVRENLEQARPRGQDG